ncbi:MAG: S1 RNA-binding domain-containing protein [Spirochaetes bacterium]|nr:S1 RNA-binding domain-containing protein [Spirochaetota bacterium]
MSNVSEQNFEENISMEELLDSVDEELEASAGEIIQGEVVSVDNNFVYLNIGQKTEGKTSVSEFKDIPSIGEKYDVLLLTRKLTDGMFVLSRKAAENAEKWKTFIAWYNDGNREVTGKITDIKQTGSIVDFGIYHAYLPISQYGDIKVKNSLGSSETFNFRILKIDEKKKSVLVSRRIIIDELKEQGWKNFISKHKENDVIEGKIVKIVEFGAFIELGGFEGLIRNNDLTWKKYFDKSDFLKLNETKKFKIISINEEKKKISLGLKQLSPDPWTVVSEKYKIGSKIEGAVTSITNFGLFVEIEQGIEGLVPLSEISWSKTQGNLSKIYKKDDKVQVQIINIDAAEKKLGLSIRMTMENPWVSVQKRFPAGTVHTSRITKIAKFGLFVEIDKDIEGMIHVSDLSWTGKTELSSFKSGQEITFKILEINLKDQKISCGLKQLEVSPWEKIKEKFPVRSIVKGPVVRITPFGMFIKVDEDVEGMVHISEISRNKIDKIEELFSVGDDVEAVVQNIDTDKRRMALSIKMLDIMQEKDNLNKLMGGDISKTASIGDLMKLKLNKGEE